MAHRYGIYGMVMPACFKCMKNVRSYGSRPHRTTRGIYVGLAWQLVSELTGTARRFTLGKDPTWMSYEGGVGHLLSHLRSRLGLPQMPEMTVHLSKFFKHSRIWTSTSPGSQRSMPEPVRACCGFWKVKDVQGRGALLPVSDGALHVGHVIDIRGLVPGVMMSFKKLGILWLLNLKKHPFPLDLMATIPQRIKVSKGGGHRAEGRQDDQRWWSDHWS